MWVGIGVVACYCIDPRGVVLASRTEWPRTPECDGQLKSRGGVLWVGGWVGGSGVRVGGWDGGWCGWVVAVDCYCLDPRGVVLASRTEWPRTPECDGQSP